MIQQATAQVLTPLWDGELSDYSFGFREGRNAHQAVRLVEGAWKLGRRHAVDCDLKAFFDTVKRDPLLVQLREKIGGGNAPAAIAASLQGEAIPHGRRNGVKLLRLIGRYLSSNRALPIAALVLYAILLTSFRTPPVVVHAAVVEGLLTALMPILIVWGPSSFSKRWSNSARWQRSLRPAFSKPRFPSGPRCLS